MNNGYCLQYNRTLHFRCCTGGDEYYPAIIDPDTSKAAEAERIKRAEKLGRIRKYEQEKEVVYPTQQYCGCIHWMPYNSVQACLYNLLIFYLCSYSHCCFS